MNKKIPKPRAYNNMFAADVLYVHDNGTCIFTNDY